MFSSTIKFFVIFFFVALFSILYANEITFLHKNKNMFQSVSLPNLNDLSNGKWLKLGIDKEGIYKITAADLQSRGINILPSQINTIKIFGQSGKPMSEKLSEDLSLHEQEIIVNTNTDGALESIIFYASAARGFEIDSFTFEGEWVYLQRHYVNYMDNRNYYLLTFGKTDGKRAVALPSVTEETTSKPTTYKASIFREEDKYMPGQMGVGLHWFGETILNDVALTDNLYNFNKNGNIEYILSVAHTNPQENTIKIYQGNNLLLNEVMHAVTGEHDYARILTHYRSTPPNQIASDNRSVLKFNYNGLSLYPFHNFYEIHYPSDMLPINNEIVLYSNIATYNNEKEIVEYNINGFKGNNIYGFDVSDMSTPKLLENIANTGGIYIFKQNEVKTNIRKYLISSNLLSPSIEEVSLLNLRDVNNKDYSNVDVIVISPDEFLESATNYANYRSNKSGLKISVVPINKIYTEFSYGRMDLVAIKNYVQYAVENWINPPTYVVLWGTGNYNFRGIEDFPNYIPAHQNTSGHYAKLSIKSDVTIGPHHSNYSTDDFYVCVVDDDVLPDVAIGRVPISTNSEGNTYVAKLEQYETSMSKGIWRRNVMIHGDDAARSNGTGSENYHINSECESISKIIPSQFIVNKVYLPEYPAEYQAAGIKRVPGATDAIFNQLNLVGNLMYLYSGHGNTNTLTHEKTFTRDMLPQFNNEDKLFLFAAGSCEVGRFDNKAGTLAADILLLPKTGAIASFAASRISGASSNTATISKLVSNLLNINSNNTYNTIGEASRITKRDTNNNSAERSMYILFGDPCLKLAAPEFDVKVDKINEIEIVDNMQAIHVKGMSYINIKGKISYNNNTTVNNFNGTINVMLNEPKNKITLIDDSENKFFYTKNGATLNSGTFQVNNGEFDIDLFIPADISFSKEKVFLHFYAISDDDRYAVGVNNDVIIDDIADDIENDGYGPELTVHLDSKLFVSGDTVSRNPLLMVHLWDATSINTTGLGIGHKIEARIDNNPYPIDLTSSFMASFTDEKSGDIQRYLGELSEGNHKLTIRAWDVFDNYTDVSVDFVIPAIKNEGILRASFTPNPATITDNIGIVVYYNVNPPIDANIIVFDEMGKEISNFNTQLTTNGYSIIDFNTKDGIPLSNGTYYYHINFKYNQTRTEYHWCEKFGSLGIITK